MNNSDLAKTFEVCLNFMYRNFPDLPLQKIDKTLHLTKKSGYFGICRRKSGYFTIGINKNFVLYGSNKAIISTLLHEITHTLPNCFNHKTQFKTVANKILELSGFDIVKYSDFSDSDSKTLKMKS